jgi:hypothetical protein
MPYIDPILTEPKQSQYIPILTGLAAPHTNNFNISILIPSISTPKHTARCLKITGNGSKSLQNLKLRNKNSKLTQAAQLSERKAHVWMKFRRQGSIFPILTGFLTNNQQQYLVDSKTIFWSVLNRGATSEVRARSSAQRGSRSLLRRPDGRWGESRETPRVERGHGSNLRSQRNSTSGPSSEQTEHVERLWGVRKIRCIAQRRLAKLVSSPYLRYLRWYLRI